MLQGFAISYFGPDGPGLISQIVGYLDEKGGSFADANFASLGGHGAEFTLIYQAPEGEDCQSLETGLRALGASKEGTFNVRTFTLESNKGPSSRITHRFILSGKDRKGFLADVIEVLDGNSAIIAHMNTQLLHGSKGDLYIARFAVSLREARAPECLAALATLCAKGKLLFRYETA